ASIFRAFSKVNLKLNMMQQEAISFEAVVDNQEDKIARLMKFLQDNFQIEIQEDLSILTLRHYNDATIVQNSAGKEVLLVQKTSTTYQSLIR
ncbi:MAG: aspartate kinase, partial [Bacteroidetes bacterium]|nr:aspartate kinase [Bacteroidota bacterium]